MSGSSGCLRLRCAASGAYSPTIAVLLREAEGAAGAQFVVDRSRDAPAGYRSAPFRPPAREKREPPGFRGDRTHNRKAGIPPHACPGLFHGPTYRRSRWSRASILGASGLLPKNICDLSPASGMHSVPYRSGEANARSDFAQARIPETPAPPRHPHRLKAPIRRWPRRPPRRMSNNLRSLSTSPAASPSTTPRSRSLNDTHLPVLGIAYLHQITRPAFASVICTRRSQLRHLGLALSGPARGPCSPRPELEGDQYSWLLRALSKRGPHEARFHLGERANDFGPRPWLHALDDRRLDGGWDEIERGWEQMRVFLDGLGVRQQEVPFGVGVVQRDFDQIMQHHVFGGTGL
ncbi:hypothetical protein BDK51DRAFT_43934 [Blyttiomyces helicus]|uniref:Uncharacterized protein n=1 Tax=Blyttiomyces helicus TaxID=388810 RepID=A0A4V1IRV5_9FUNG|nr:hypothetical protein BDK51DRAFT_43934 [Blyttiomyces helicus]|eukprot:RKO91377.1 hypothetical protein BDK51DRAFT_43934 [Blyttiomyces helicus]